MPGSIKQPYWLQSDAGHHDVVLSTRFRLARNLHDFAFPNRAAQAIRLAVRENLERAVSHEFPHWRLLRIEEMTPLLLELFYEKHLVSHHLKSHPAGTALGLSPEARFVLMINEEDHLRIQLLLPGLALQNSWKELLNIETRLGRWVDYSSDRQFGFLTSCLTNVGTGLRASAMVHLPGLNWTGELHTKLENWPDDTIEFRGAFGEGSSMEANLVQVSNRYTLGSNVKDITERVFFSVNRLVEMEREARQRIMAYDQLRLSDAVHRALGLLKSCRLISSGEATAHLSGVRLGSVLGLLPGHLRGDILRLLVNIRPAHLQTTAEQTLEPVARDEWRARFIRQQFESFGL